MACGPWASARATQIRVYTTIFTSRLDPTAKATGLLAHSSSIRLPPSYQRLTNHRTATAKPIFALVEAQDPVAFAGSWVFSLLGLHFRRVNRSWLQKTRSKTSTLPALDNFHRHVAQLRIDSTPSAQRP